MHKELPATYSKSQPCVSNVQHQNSVALLSVPQGSMHDAAAASDGALAHVAGCSHHRQYEGVMLTPPYAGGWTDTVASLLKVSQSYLYKCCNF